MSLLREFDRIRLVKVGPSLRERMERWLELKHRRVVIARLCFFRESLQRDMAPEPWAQLRAPMVLVLSDVCDALRLDEAERAVVLGVEGEQVRERILDTGVTPQRSTPNERQMKVLEYLEEHDAVTMGHYRRLCPEWSKETLRRDLVDLAERGLLKKNGRKKGTYYTGTD
jgi:hypothetical protein